MHAPGPEPPPVTRFYEWECERFLRDQRRDVRWYRRLAAETGGPVLELACGAGRVCLALAADGFDVVGLDIQPHLLQASRAHAQRRDLTERCAFAAGDMRDFRLERQFPLILLAYNTLGYLLTDEEVIGCLRCVAAHLATGGVFALQVTPFEVGEPGRPRGFVAAGPYEDGQLEMYESVTAEPERHITHYDEEYQWRRRGRPALIFRQRLSLRSFYRPDILRLLAAGGLRARAVHGDFDGRPHPLPGRPGGPILFEAVGVAAGGDRSEA